MHSLKPVIYTTSNKLHKYLRLIYCSLQLNALKGTQMRCISKLFNVKTVTNLCRFSPWNNTSICNCFASELQPRAALWIFKSNTVCCVWRGPSWYLAQSPRTILRQNARIFILVFFCKVVLSTNLQHLVVLIWRRHQASSKERKRASVKQMVVCRRREALRFSRLSLKLKRALLNQRFSIFFPTSGSQINLNAHKESICERMRSNGQGG